MTMMFTFVFCFRCYPAGFLCREASLLFLADLDLGAFVLYRLNLFFLYPLSGLLFFRIDILCHLPYFLLNDYLNLIFVNEVEEPLICHSEGSPERSRGT